MPLMSIRQARLGLLALSASGHERMVNGWAAASGEKRKKPVPEGPQWLAVRSSSAQGPSGTGFFHFRLGHVWRQARTVSGCLNSAFLGLFLYQLRPQLFRPWIPNPTRRQHFPSRSDRFWLLELRVSRTFLDQLRP